MERFEVQSNDRCEMIPITREVQDIVSRNSISEGICLVFVPHTTAAVTIN